MEAVVNPESSEGFPSGLLESRSLRSDFKDIVGEFVGRCRVFVTAFHQLFHNVVTRGSFHRTLESPVLVKDKTLGQKGVESELSGKLQGKDGASDDGYRGAERKCVE